MGMTLLAFIAVGFVAISIFRIDPVSTMHTVTGMIHIGISAMVSSLFPVSTFFISHSLKKHGEIRLSRYTLAVGTFGLLVLMIRVIPAWSQLFGLQELIGGASALLWALVISLHFLRRSYCRL